MRSRYAGVLLVALVLLALQAAGAQYSALTRIDRSTVSWVLGAGS
jgi:hypothetical protein